MKRIVSLAALLLLAATTLSAGLRYEFSSVTAGKGGARMVGIAQVEGKNMRIDFAEGDRMLFQNNSVVLSHDGGKTLIITNPEEKTYYEMNLEEMLGAMGSMMKAMGGMFQMSFDDMTAEVVSSGDGGSIEGYPTKRSVIRTAYDMNMKIMGMKSSSHVETTTEVWATDKLGAEFATFVQQKGLKTGMADLDKLIEAQSQGVEGFPLKQVVTMKTTQGKKTDTATTTMTVTKIEKVNVPDSAFAIPAGYEKGESPLEAMQSMGRR